MPSLTIFKGCLNTRPFASDDMHIVCIILSSYRAIQLICLLPLLVAFYLRRVKGQDVLVKGVPSWCSQYQYAYNFTYLDGEIPKFKEDIEIDYSPDMTFWDEFLTNAVVYLLIDVTWIIMVWRSASIGTPTEPMRRDKYIRNLIIFKMFIANTYPIALIGMGIYHVWDMRNSNYWCGDGEYISPPGENVWSGLFSCLVVTYALELLVWPAIFANKLTKIFKINCLWDRNRVGGRGGKAERFETNLGIILKILSCITRGKAGGKDLKNKGELKDFASHVMCLLNNQTKMDLTLSDIYVGMRMLSWVQGERKVEAIKEMALKNKLLQRLSDGDDETGSEILTSDSAPKIRRRSSVLVLQMKHNKYEVCQRELLHKSNASDVEIMSDGAHFVRYASYIYVKIPNCLNEFVESEEECSGFVRELDTLFCDEFRLASIGLADSILCYSNFVNGIVSTPYSIIVDKEKGNVVIAVRGTRSIEDLVVDVQFIPESLEKVGKVCGFDGSESFCHKGFLARSKWIYNDIKKAKVLKTLYSELSPYKEYPLVLCGHSLGAGVASILSLMLRPSFPSLKCFAFEPPGCIFDEETQNSAMCDTCNNFIERSYIKLLSVPRLSYHNFESLRESFFEVFARIKVPKIQLFYFWKVPYSERFVATRNSEVLRPQEKIPFDTKFNQQLKLFKAERSDKNNSGVNRVQLFIPGKIIHLVDTNGDGNYIPYYASKSEFNQLEISKRMYSDHGIHELVDILGDIRLGGDNSMPLAFHNAPQIYVEDDDSSVVDVRLFACGKLPITLWIICLIASSLSAGITCDFIDVSFNATKYGLNNTFLNMTFGIYSYEILDCEKSSGKCELVESYLDNAECISYPPDWEPDGFMQASRAFHILASLVGGLVLFMLTISMCFIFSRKTWQTITAFLLITGAIKMIVACCLWFTTAVGSVQMVRARKETGRQK